MKVTLISYSKPAEQMEGLNDIKDLIAYCARVSNPSNQLNTETSEKLLGYLAKHKHWSPFEMASACLEIETTRDIARQILRHRSFSFQEFSQRYANPDQEFDEMFVKREARLQDEKNRQNSVEVDDKELELEWYRIQGRVQWIRSWIHYIELRRENGTQKEHMEIAKACAEAISKIYTWD